MIENDSFGGRLIPYSHYVMSPSHLIYTAVMLMERPQGKLSCSDAELVSLNIIDCKMCVCAFSFWYVGQQVGLAHRASDAGQKRCFQGI